MIKSLRIRNLATIEDLEVRLDEGFSILTGETGAGKSIIIDAIRLILGDKSSADVIRSGKRDCHIEAIFEAGDAPAEAVDSIPPGEGGEILMQRQISGQGAGKVYINGVLSPLRKLKELGPYLIDVYGQNDHTFLLQTENHLRYLDDFLNSPDLIRSVGQAAHRLRALLREKKELEIREKERETHLDFLDFQIREIEDANLAAEEEKELLESRAILKNMEKISILLDKALDISSQGENSLLPLLAQCQSVLGELASFAPSFGEFRPGLEESLILIQDLTDSLVRFKDRRTDSPDNLEDIEERLSLIEKLKRKHDGSLEAVLERLESMKKERRALETRQERLGSLKKEIDKAFLQYADAAQKLGSLRTAKAGELGRLIEEEIALLGMRKAKFEVRISSFQPDLDNPETLKDTGTERAEFVISPNPGEDMKPLRKIASGGELSRIMLALKVVGEETEGRKTLIFDEIDAGIGGKTADFIAQKLRQLALRHQVLCITHLPQIASAATHHYRVDKTTHKNRTYTSINELDQEERPMELARLISGSRVTQTSLETAKEMLESHQNNPNEKKRDKGLSQ